MKRYVAPAVISLTSAVALTACGDLDSGNDDGSGEWTPSSTVRVIVPYEAGGGTDLAFRRLVDVINESELSDVRWIVENRDGAGGTTAMRFVAGQEGDDHLLMATTPGHISVPILQDLDVTIDDLTPVANTVIDPQVLFAHEKTGLKSAEQVVTQLEKKPESLSMAGAPVGQDDHLTTLVFEQATETKFNFVPFTGGDEVKTNILGGQVDVAWLNPAEAEGQRVEEGGPLVPIAVALEDEVEGLEGVPTFVEDDYDVVYDQFFRGLTGPPGMSDEAVDYLADVVEQATETEEWADFVAEAKTVANYLPPEEFSTALEEWTDKVETLLESQ